MFGQSSLYAGVGIRALRKSTAAPLPLLLQSQKGSLWEEFGRNQGSED